MTSEEITRVAIAERQGGTEWRLQIDEEPVATGGILFHYNAPYGDVYIDVAEPFRRRGLGSYLLQELKRVAYELGTVPCARCNPDNVASRKALQKAGFVAYAHMLNGSIPPLAPSATRVTGSGAHKEFNPLEPLPNVVPTGEG